MSFDQREYIHEMCFGLAVFIVFMFLAIISEPDVKPYQQEPNQSYKNELWIQHEDKSEEFLATIPTTIFEKPVLLAPTDRILIKVSPPR